MSNDKNDLLMAALVVVSMMAGLFGLNLLAMELLQMYWGGQ